jgi:hypothetical protein
VSKILLTLRLSQDNDEKPKGDQAWDRQFWICTKTDLAAALDTVEAEAHLLFNFDTTGVTETFEKEGDDE